MPWQSCSCTAAFQAGWLRSGAQSVVCEEEVADCGYLHSGLGLESSQIEKLAVGAVAQVYPHFFRTERICQHG